jgi:antitoxin SocA-like protein
MPANVQLSKEEQMLAYFVHRLEGQRFGRTALMKFLYLADYESRRFLGRAISDVAYIWHHYGPYDTAFPANLTRLAESNIIVHEEFEFDNGKTVARFRTGTAAPTYSLRPEEFSVLQYVCDHYSGMDLQVLLNDIVYETEPMIDAKARNAKGKKLRMQIADGLRSNELGIPFEELLQRSFEARAGATITAEEFKAEVLALDCVAA